MKPNTWFLLALVPIALILVEVAAFGAQLAVLGVTLGIFFGTLSLRKSPHANATTTNPGRS